MTKWDWIFTILGIICICISIALFISVGYDIGYDAGLHAKLSTVEIPKEMQKLAEEYPYRVGETVRRDR